MALEVNIQLHHSSHQLIRYIGPHIGPEYAWPMSLLVQAMTSDNDTEISECIDLVLKASRLGLVHESINVNVIKDYTRSWFACKSFSWFQSLLIVHLQNCIRV